MKRFFTALLFFVALLAIWHFGRHYMVGTKRWSPVLVPTPLSVWQYLVSAADDGTLWEALVVTTKRLLIGYFAGVILGVPLGLLTARFKWAGDTIGVLGLGLQTLPSVCWVPLALLWFPDSEVAMFFVVVMGTLWPVAVT